MDQGLVATEFAPAAATRAKAAGHVNAKLPAAESKLSAAEAIAKGASVGGGVARGERKAEEGLRDVQSKLMLPTMLEFAGILTTPLVWIAKKVKSPKMEAVIGSALGASRKALDTKVTDAFQIPANYMEAVAEQASAANVQSWAASATAKSATLKTGGAAAQSKVAEFAKPLTSGIARAVESFSQTGFVKAMPAIVKSTFGKARGATVFQALVTAGVATGMVATLVGMRAESKETKAAYKELIADIGGDATSPFAKAMKDTFATKKKWGVAKTGIELAGGVIEGVMWTKPGFGGMAMMGAVMMPQICSSLVPESPTLGAYVALKKADAGELKIDNDARIDLIKNMISVMPSVEAHGGQYNRLVTPLAKELVSRSMSAQQVAQLLDNDAAFTRLAGEVSAKLPVVAKKTDAAPHAAVSKAHAAYHGAEKPAAIVSGQALQHQGTVAAQQLQRA